MKRTPGTRKMEQQVVSRNFSELAITTLSSKTHKVIKCELNKKQVQLHQDLPTHEQLESSKARFFPKTPQELVGFYPFQSQKETVRKATCDRFRLQIFQCLVAFLWMVWMVTSGCGSDIYQLSEPGRQAT